MRLSQNLCVSGVHSSTDFGAADGRLAIRRGLEQNGPVAVAAPQVTARDDRRITIYSSHLPAFVAVWVKRSLAHRPNAWLAAPYWWYTGRGPVYSREALRAR